MPVPLLPLLINYAGKRCGPPSPVVDAPRLTQWLAQNSLMLRHDTLADGNCGIHAFFLSLCDFARLNPGFKTSAAWKRLSRLSFNVADTVQHLRKVAVDWMADHADAAVWDGMTFRDLACQMSHLQEPFDVHLERMSRDKQWVDASVIHALACVFQVDVGIWQEHLESLLVGQSLECDGLRSSGLIPMALKNDYHF